MKDELGTTGAAIGMVILACLFGGLALAIYPGGAEIWMFMTKNLRIDKQNWLESFFGAIAAIAAALAAYAAWMTILTARKLKQDDELLAHATVTLERAYAALMNGCENDAHPRADRLNWLTSARLIEDFRATKKQIKTSEILRRCEGHEEFWRNKIYQKLSPLALNINYFRPASRGGSIHLISAAIVNGFADWPAGRADRIDNYASPLVVIEEHGLSRQWAGLRHSLGLL